MAEIERPLRRGPFFVGLFVALSLDFEESTINLETAFVRRETCSWIRNNSSRLVQVSALEGSSLESTTFEICSRS